jgi:hypothetical protein
VTEHAGEVKTDLSQIRGDWNFHMRFVTNALEQTIKRLNKTWDEMKATSESEGEVTIDSDLCEEFIEACRQTRGLTDDLKIMADCKP